MCVVCVSGPDQLPDASFVSSEDEALFPSAVEHQVRDSDGSILSQMGTEACSAVGSAT